MRSLVAIIAVAVTTSAASADKADEACKDAGTGSYQAFNACAGAGYKETDRNLNKLFAKVLSDTKKHTNAKEVEKSLRAAQRAWLTYRDRTCEMASWIESWAHAPDRRSVCMSVLTAKRIEEIKEIQQCIQSGGYSGDCPLSQ